MRQLDRTVRVIADKDVSVLLIGESGSGKEIVARRIHELSDRRAQPFVPINCAAIPEALFESELFGHEKGAFTGASDRARGKVEAADRGTLFLDEIGEMPISVQAKLLRFLEHRRFMRVGGSTKLAVDTRLICATLRPLELEVADARFRADLFYRIQGITLAVPPLRERPADLPALVEQLVAQLSAKHGTAPPRIGRSVMSAFKSYAWPGNVRELKNAIELVILLRAGKKVRLRDLPKALVAAAPPAREVPTGARVEVSLDRPLDESLHRIVRAALALEAGNRTRAAERLGISVRTIQRYLAQDSLREPELTSPA